MASVTNETETTDTVDFFGVIVPEAVEAFGFAVEGRGVGENHFFTVFTERITFSQKGSLFHRGGAHGDDGWGGWRFDVRIPWMVGGSISIYIVGIVLV